MTVERRPAHRRAPVTALYDRRPWHHPPMRATEHRIRTPRRLRHTAPATPAPIVAAAPVPVRAGLGLNALELEDLLMAVGTLEDQAGADQRARLARGRRALEAELARALTA